MDNIMFNGETDAELMLRLADLMEAGCVGKRQITGQYFEIDGNGVCAMGAALAAVGVKSAPSDFIPVNNALQVTTWPRIQYPESDIVPFVGYNGTAPLPDVVIFMNDRLGWTFQQIIAWLRETAAQATIISKDA